MTDHKAEADELDRIADDAGSNDGRVIVWAINELTRATRDLAEQQRVANLIALDTAKFHQYGSYSGSSLTMDNPVTQSGNMTVKPEIAVLLGLDAS